MTLAHLMEVISSDQIVFFPFRYIFDNVLLTNEMSDWVTCSNQPLVLLKLDFARMYDKIRLEFLFLTLKKMGMAEKFVGMVKMLIQDAKAYICFKEGITNVFKIEKGVKQRCLLAPYHYRTCKGCFQLHDENN